MLLLSSRHPGHYRLSWAQSEARGLEWAVELRSVGCVLPLSEVYERVEL